MNLINFIKNILQYNIISKRFKIFYLIWFLINVLAYIYLAPKLINACCYALTLNHGLMYFVSLFGIFLIAKELFEMNINNFVNFRKNVIKISTLSNFNLLSSLFVFSLIHVFFITLPHMFIYFIDIIIHINQFFIIFMTFIELITFLSYITFLGVVVFSCVIITITIKNGRFKNYFAGIIAACIVLFIFFLFIPFSSWLSEYVFRTGTNYNKLLSKTLELIDYLSIQYIACDVSTRLPEVLDNINIFIPRFVYVISSYLFFTILVLLLDYFMFYNRFNDYLNYIENKIKNSGIEN